MKKMLQIGSFLMLAGALAIAQPGTGMKNNGTKMPRYDVATETTFTGTVQEVLQPQSGRMTGTHLIVKTASGTLEVHLGPTSFVTGKGFNFAKDDSVQVVGSKVKVDGKDVVIAREVTREGKTLTLRDKAGRPLWARRTS
ncbi:MAG: hypothetical protein LAO79_11775 [Acidobacteriia bacterium]|nr:hypothetical protein [Terriglobia bacterium]